MIPGQLTYDMQSPPPNPWEDGIPQDVIDKATNRLMARGITDPTDEQLTDMCVVVWNDESEWEREP